MHARLGWLSLATYNATFTAAGAAVGRRTPLTADKAWGQRYPHPHVDKGGPGVAASARDPLYTDPMDFALKALGGWLRAFRKASGDRVEQHPELCRYVVGEIDKRTAA